MSALLSEERLADRARDLAASGHNGMRLVYVSLEAVAKPTFAWLDVEWHNANANAASRSRCSTAFSKYSMAWALFFAVPHPFNV